MSVFYLFVTIILSLIPFLFIEGGRSDIYVIVSGCIVTVLSCIVLTQHKERPYSLYRMVSIFFLFFFSIAPILQYKNDIRMFGGGYLPDNAFLLTNIVLIAIIIQYSLFYTYFFRRRREHKRLESFLKIFSMGDSTRIESFSLLCLYILSIICLFLVLQSNHFNLQSLLVRGGDISSRVNMEQSFSLILSNYIRPIPLLVFFIYSFLRKNNDIHCWVFFLIGLLSTFPLGLARFAAATLYIPFFLLYIPFVKKRNVFPVLLVLGLLIVFPFLNNFRHFSSDTEIAIGLDFEMFTDGHFDSYQSLLRVLFNEIITYGEQLLGVLFFWIPRTVWPSKPVGSGSFMSEKLGLDFGNISCNYFAEGFINFGFLGVFLFVILLAYITATLDKLYWRYYLNANNRNNIFHIWYFLLFGFVFFILRGDMLSSTAYLTGFSLAFFSILALLKFSLKLKNNT